LQKKKTAMKKYTKNSKVKNDSNLEFLEYKEYNYKLDEEKYQVETKLINLIDEGFKNSFLELELKRSSLINQHCIDLFTKQCEYQRKQISLDGIHRMNMIDHEYQHESEKINILQKYLKEIIILDTTQSKEMILELEDKSRKLEAEVQERIKKIERKTQEKLNGLNDEYIKFRSNVEQKIIDFNQSKIVI